jgi:hypothetical protein
MGLWLAEDLDLNDDEIWELFVVLLESRVELLKACKDGGMELSPEVCLPQWLAKLTNSQKETRLRELKKLSEKQRNMPKYRAYETTAAIKKEADE